MFDFKQYTADQKPLWDQFVKASRNGTFLLLRDYMDYHADRFQDHSLLIYRQHRIFALLPANRVGEVLHSHQGLTYAGLIMGQHADACSVLQLFQELHAYLYAEGFRKVVYKPIPYIFHRQPSQEDLYALFRLTNARFAARNISSTIDQGNKLRFTESRRSGIRKAQAQGLTISESTDLQPFYDILCQNLHDKYQATPVHSLAELQLLQSRFPQSIRLYTANLAGRILGGALLYIMPPVVHTQYISASSEGKQTGALDLLFDHLINTVYPHIPYFDLGTSNEQGGRVLNESLIFQKIGFGGRGVMFDTYEYDLLPSNS